MNGVRSARLLTSSVVQQRTIRLLAKRRFFRTTAPTCLLRLDVTPPFSYWMDYFSKKAPKGFEDFFPDGHDKERRTNRQQETEDYSKKSFDFKQDRKRHETPPPPNNDDAANFPGLLALLALILALRQYTEEEEQNYGQEITFVDFRNKLLSTGNVEKLVVINNSLAQVVLKEPLHPSAAAAAVYNNESETILLADDTNQHDIQLLASNETSMDGSTTTTSTTTAPPHKKYFFYIGSVENLEHKLTQAQAHLSPEQWTEVQYVSRTNVIVEALKLLPMVAFVAAVYFGTKGAVPKAGSGGSNNSIFGIGRSNARKIRPEDVKIGFADVAGCDEAKKETMEFVEFLKDSERFTKLGAKIPKGALLCGPPGTGKTLLAKAVAGEAGVPFYSISGSDFIEMFVGVGPSRVRDLFREARKNAPCIVFIDEIDAVGRQRGRDGFSGGNDERENTLNQLLVEMDGFSPTTGVVVLAGTNRADILDQALTRPGRFDRQITVDKPDLKGRKEIFEVHLKGITLAGPIDDFAGRLAGLTPGFAGADIANICNEAAIVAARRKAEAVTIEDFEMATDRVIGGLASNKIMSAAERSIVAHHEAGHAVAGWFLEHADPLLKVTIIPRTSGALGFAQYLPKEVFLRSQDQIMDIVCMALAGRASEQVFFGRVTTGASDDLRRVTQLVYSMIKDFGMNTTVGQLSFPSNRDTIGDKPYSDSTAEAMDDEARAIVDAAYERTIQLITEHKEDVDKLAKLLLEQETITHDDIVDLVGARPFRGDKAYDEYVSSRKATDKKDDKKKDEELTIDDTGEFTPGLA